MIAISKAPMRRAEGLSNETVVQMRTMRYQHKTDWRTLGALFGIHPKTAYRICVGLIWEEAGGPMEHRIARALHDVDTPKGRCKLCGGLYLGTFCLACHRRFEGLLVDLLIDAELLTKRQVRQIYAAGEESACEGKKKGKRKAVA